MKNQETKQEVQPKSLTQTNPQPIPPKSSLQARKNRRLALRFSPTAWAKLLYFRDKSANEVGGFAVTGPDDLLLVTDFITVKQEVTSVSVKFDDIAIADFFEQQVDLGRKPEQFARIWLHTHPADFAEPSLTDEHTFARAFDNCQWAVMFILAENNKSYARLSFNVGPGGQLLIPVEVDYSQDFGASDKTAWDIEYQTNVKAVSWSGEIVNSKEEQAPVRMDFSGSALPYIFLDEFEKLEPPERRIVMDELAERPDLWDDESEVMFL